MKTEFDYSVVADFLDSSVRERIVHELSSPKKRIKAIDRFSHNTDSIINTKWLYFKGNSINETIKNEIKSSTAEGVVLSFKHQDGERMSTDDAFDYLDEECSVILVMMGKWLIIKPEYEGGEGNIFVLKNNENIFCLR